MIRIHKLPEPPGLKKYKSEKGLNRSYEDGSDCFTHYKICESGQTEYCYTSPNPNNESAFDELRRQLLKEQKYVCCYCGSEIPAVFNKNGKEQMKTEHFEPKKGKNARPDLQLTYSNLLAVCMGNSHSEGEKHCDSRKGDAPLTYLKNPAHAHFVPLFEYRILPAQKKVTLHAKKGLTNAQEIQIEIDTVLNLNEQSLAQRRYMYWDIKVNRPLKDKWTKAKVEALISELGATSHAKHIPFLEVIVWYLKEKHTKL